MFNQAIKALKLRVKRRKPADSVKVFCIGLQKTGTTTFQKCMETLGYDHKGNSPEIFSEWLRNNKSAVFDIIENTIRSMMFHISSSTGKFLQDMGPAHVTSLHCALHLRSGLKA
jgi:hypothetical protein